MRIARRMRACCRLVTPRPSVWPGTVRYPVFQSDQWPRAQSAERHFHTQCRSRCGRVFCVADAGHQCHRPQHRSSVSVHRHPCRGVEHRLNCRWRYRHAAAALLRLDDPGLHARQRVRLGQITLGEAVAASCCIPGLFEPLALHGLYEGATASTWWSGWWMAGVRQPGLVSRLRRNAPLYLQ